ncbi:OLC1v1026472C1 [Oldenlandia corymbosa var. corymbosa]|nr:OLC1v1026472C1 [Oldenlandia corymbosa var. corymbosa]
MYLAAIADSQPQPPNMHSQFPPTGIVQPGAQHYLQQQQAQQMASQSLLAARSSMLYGQQQFSALQQQQALNSQLGMTSGVSAGLPILQGEAHNAGGGSGALGSVGFPDFIRGPTGEGGGLHAGSRGMASGSKHEMLGGMSAEGRGGSSGGGHNIDGSETLFLKSGDHDHGN